MKNLESQKVKKCSLTYNLQEFIVDEEHLSLIDEKVIFCNLCETNIKCDKKQGRWPIANHLSSKKHQEKITEIGNKSNTIPNKNDPSIELLRWMLINNIPLSKLDKKEFTYLLKENSNLKIFSSSHYRKNLLPKYYEEMIQNIKNTFQEKSFYIMFDESPDKIKRKILNILIGELSENEHKKPLLIDTVEMDVVNADKIAATIIFLLCEILKSEDKRSNFKVLISDKAAYAVAAGKLLKNVYPKLLHVTCFCHALHNFSTFIMNRHKCSFEFDKEFKKYFKYNKKDRIKFKTITKLKFPKISIQTRWGTYIEFMTFFYDNYQELKVFFETYDEGSVMKKLFFSEEFINELISLNNYRNLPLYIKRLEKDGLTISEQCNIINEMKNEIKPGIYFDEYERICKTNPGYEFFFNYNILKCNAE